MTLQELKVFQGITPDTIVYVLKPSFELIAYEWWEIEENAIMMKLKVLSFSNKLGVIICK